MVAFLVDDHCTCERCLAVVEMERRVRLAMEEEGNVRAALNSLEPSYRTIAERERLLAKKGGAWAKVRLAKVDLDKARTAAIHNAVPRKKKRR